MSKLWTLFIKSGLEMIIHTFTSSCLDFGNSLLTCVNKSAVTHLQLVQNATARL